MRSCIVTSAAAFPIYWFSVLTLVTRYAVAGQEFGIEDGLAKLKDVPPSAATDIENHLTHKEEACFADAKTTARDALEAASIDLGGSIRTLLLKPKLPSEPKAAWGCFRGANMCPMWIYSVESGEAHRVWSSTGASLEIIDRKDLGSKRLLVSSSSAGHKSVALYAWNGREYKLLREKSAYYGKSKDFDERAEKEIAKFKIDAAY